MPWLCGKAGKAYGPRLGRSRAARAAEPAKVGRVRGRHGGHRGRRLWRDGLARLARLARLAPLRIRREALRAAPGRPLEPGTATGADCLSCPKSVLPSPPRPAFQTSISRRGKGGRRKKRVERSGAAMLGHAANPGWMSRSIHPRGGGGPPVAPGGTPYACNKGGSTLGQKRKPGWPSYGV